MSRVGQAGVAFTFDPHEANKVCEFIEELPHVEGRWDSATIKLHPAHVFFLVNLFGFRSAEGGRRYTSALFWVARKNAKSTLAAAILLYCLCCEGEVGPQVISAATTGAQARAVFNIAKRMVELTPDLRDAFGVEPFANSIACWPAGGFFKPINAKASTQDGLNPSHTELDEIHAHKTSDLVNVLRSAAGARSNPLWLYTTTEGYPNAGPWEELRDFATHLLDGTVEADHFLVVAFTLDMDDDEFDESKWVKANPLIDVNPVLLREIRKEAAEAKQMPGRLAEFRTKRLNRRSSTAHGWVQIEPWLDCGKKPIDLDLLKGVPCWGGLDLASNRDFCSLRLIWSLDGDWYTWGMSWVPEDAIKMRTERGTFPYQKWVDQGFMKKTPGPITDHDIVLADLLDLKRRFNLQSVAYDGWNAAQFAQKAKDAGVEMTLFIQGPKSYHPAMQAFERAYIGRKFHHGANPVLTWCASNLVVRYDANRNMAPDKQRAKEKIDEMVALLMALGEATRQGQKEYNLVFV